MLVDGISLLEGSDISNLTVASGTSFPSSPNAGELFYRTDTDGLFVHNGAAWVSAGGGGALSYTITGDVTGTIDGGTDTLTLGIVNSGIGSFGSASSVPTLTVNGKGLVTAASSASIQISESQVTDGTLLARLAANETVSGSWTFGSPISGAFPSLGDHLATKDYVDAFAAGINVHEAARVATTGNITLTGLQTIDGITVSAGNRVLVKDQSTGSLNGIYVAASGSWARAADYDGAPTAEVASGDFVFVTSGSANGNKGFVLTTPPPITLGVTALTWTVMSSAGTGVTSVNLIQPSAGITVSGGPITTSGSITLTLADDLAAVESLASTGIVRRTGTSTWSAGTAIDLSSEVTGTLGIPNGGTGQTAYGTTGQVLTSNGTGVSPSWQAVSASAATNIAGGAATQIPFQSGVGATTFSSNFTYSPVGDVSRSPNTDALFMISAAADSRMQGAPGVSISGSTAPGLNLSLVGGQGSSDTNGSNRGGNAILMGGTASHSSGSTSGTLTGGNAILRGGVAVVNGSTSTKVGGYISFETGPVTTLVERFRILNNGAWSVGTSGTAAGTAGQVLTSTGSSSPPTWSAATVTDVLGINGTAGGAVSVIGGSASASFGVGGTVTITGGAASGSFGGSGGVAISGGGGGNASNASGGSISLFGGTGNGTGSHGNIDIRGGAGGTTSTKSGNITLITGGSTVNRGDFSVFTRDGSGNLQAAFVINPDRAVSFGASGTNFGTAGQMLVSGGSASNPTWASATTISTTSTGSLDSVWQIGRGHASAGSTGITGTGTYDGLGQPVRIYAGQMQTSGVGGSLLLSAGDGGGGTAAGGNTFLKAGDSISSSGAGGNVDIRAGAGGISGGGGAGGYVVLFTAPSNTQVERLRILNNGAWSVGTGGTATGTSGQVLTSTGATTAPTWQAVPLVNATVLGTVANTAVSITGITGTAASAPMTIQPGNAGTGTGNPLTLNGGVAGTTSAGGAVTITGGAGLSASAGGAISITSGTSGGSAGAVSGTVTIASGAGLVNGGAGSISILGGDTANNATVAAITITSGPSSGQFTTGAVNIKSANGTGVGASGVVTLRSGSGGATSTTTGAMTVGTGDGPAATGALSIVTGNSSAGTAGNITIAPGTGAIAGGSIIFRTAATTTLATRLTIAPAGNVTIAAPASGTALTVTSSVASIPGLMVSGSSINMADFESTAANGGYIRLITSATVYADIGTQTQAFGAGGAGNLGINARGATELGLGTNSTKRLFIGSAGNVTINAPSSGPGLDVQAPLGVSIAAGTLPQVAGTAIFGLHRYMTMGQVTSGSSTGFIGWNAYPTATPSSYTYRFAADAIGLLEFSSSGGLTFRSAAAGSGAATLSDSFTIMGASAGGAVVVNSTTNAGIGGGADALAVNGGIGLTSQVNFSSVSAELVNRAASGTMSFYVNAGATIAMVMTSNGDIESGTDNTKKMGTASKRWSEVFAGNAAINTSDANLKEQITSLSVAELAVATAAKGLLKKFKFKDAVLLKGAGARWHIGLIAQDLEAAFTAQGLDAHAYGMFCEDTWWTLADEIVEAGTPGAVEVTRLGVRYEELLAFIIAAM